MATRRGGNPVKGKSSARTAQKQKPKTADEISLEDAEETIRQLKSRIDKAKKLGQQKKKQASRQAEADAEQEYQRQTQARDSSSAGASTPVPQPAPKAPSNRLQSSTSHGARSRASDDDAYSVSFDDPEDDFVPEVRPVDTENDLSTSPGTLRRSKRKNAAESDGEAASADEPSIAKTTAPAAKKRKGAGAAMVEVADTAAPLRRTLASRKHAAPTASQPGDQLDESDEEEEGEGERTIGEHTPYKRKINESDEKKPRLKDLSPTSKKIAKILRNDFTILVCTINAFPDDDAANDMVDELFVEATSAAVDGSKIARRVERYAADSEYQTDIQLVGQNVDAGFRGRVVATAQPLVDQKYGFENDTSTAEARKANAGALTKKGAFAHRDWKTRKGYLLNPLLWRLLAKHFLAKRGKSRKALIQPGHNMTLFKEMRNELIAFLLTAIHCAIDGWSSGTFAKAEFSKTDYETKYKAHLSTIKTVAEGNPDYMAKVRGLIWDEACKIAGLSASISVEEDAGGETPTSVNPSVSSSPSHQLRGVAVAPVDDTDRMRRTHTSSSASYYNRDGRTEYGRLSDCAVERRLEEGGLEQREGHLLQPLGEQLAPLVGELQELAKEELAPLVEELQELAEELAPLE
ncbi:hypothetical protein AURDEDRAFT_173254 [Auricularia subglabra TFB-10046 SS5]|uniref:DUF6532 domain-containing protein n=1 Tax=Auricularia subglabra (strain TFB-10046 / SS5) TaxID=717982 RepID=J0DB69_AURST|nr:hypothetical protein AURDEDRAFT_173254 [Auricularia subglabra TFB-10046 SS5]